MHRKTRVPSAERPGNKMSRKVLGLDIRKDAVTAVMLNSGIKGSEIIDRFTAPIQGEGSFFEALHTAIETICNKMKVDGANCTVSLPPGMASYRNIRVPFVEIKKIRQVLPFELEPAIPMPIEDLEIDFEPMKSNGESDIVAAWLEKSVLEKLLETLAVFHLNPVVITPGGYAGAAFLGIRDDIAKDMLVIDYDPNRVSVFALSSGKIRFARTFPQKPPAQAEAGYLRLNIQRTLTAVQDSLNILFSPEIILTIGDIEDDMFVEGKENKLMEVPVAKSAPAVISPSLKTKPGDQNYKSGAYDNALCLALCEAEGIHCINFSKNRSRATKYWTEYKPNFKATAILAAFVILIAYGGLNFKVHTLNNKITGINQQINHIFSKTFPNVKRIVDPLQQMKVKVKEAKKDSAHTHLTGDRIKVVDILNHLSKNLPKKTDVDFARMVVGNDSITLSGATDTFNTVDDMKSRLDKVEPSKKVTISSANMDKSGKRVRFKLKIEL